jgi:hypothetical protein
MNKEQFVIVVNSFSFTGTAGMVAVSKKRSSSVISSIQVSGFSASGSG